MKKLTLFSVVLIGGIGVSSAWAEVKYAPYVNSELYVGQSRFSGNDASPVSSMNGSVVVVPGLRLSDRLSLLPSLSYGYRKARDVQELVGGSFLSQQQQTASLGLKTVYVLKPGLKAKLTVSRRQEMLKETSDETWGNGLFDYDKNALGMELEKEGTFLRSLRVGVDYYAVRFPNFQTLASKYYGTEINSGKDVLDFNAADVSLGGDLLLAPGRMLSLAAVGSSRDYYDQKIVSRGGTYSADERSDSFYYLSAGYRHQLPELVVWIWKMESLGGLDVSYASLNSNQNNYDAGRTTFNQNYYDYTEIGFGPRVNTRWNGKLTAGLAMMWNFRDYADRPVQNADGTYKTGTSISNTVNTLRWTVGYPLWRGLSLQAQGAFQNADSNMDYETVYRYNYSSSHFFLGFTYQL